MANWRSSPETTAALAVGDLHGDDHHGLVRNYAPLRVRWHVPALSINCVAKRSMMALFKPSSCARARAAKTAKSPGDCKALISALVPLAGPEPGR